MPTGATATRGNLEKLVRFAQKHEILLVNDNPYSFVLNTDCISILEITGSKEVALELNSLSKTFNMAGWRVGMVLGGEAHIEAILKVKSNMDSGMFYGVQKGGIAALNSSKDWFRQLNNTYADRRKRIYALADKLQCTYDENAVGMFVWAKLPKEVKSAEEFIDKVLHEKHIFITPGTIFGTNGEGYIRFSLCVVGDKINEAINRFES